MPTTLESPAVTPVDGRPNVYDVAFPGGPLRVAFMGHVQARWLQVSTFISGETPFMVRGVPYSLSVTMCLDPDLGWVEGRGSDSYHSLRRAGSGRAYGAYPSESARAALIGVCQTACELVAVHAPDGWRAARIAHLESRLQTIDSQQARLRAASVMLRDDGELLQLGLLICRETAYGEQPRAHATPEMRDLRSLLH